MKQLLTSPRGKKSMKLLGGLIVLLVVFQAGVFVGFHKASIGFGFDEHAFRAYREHFHRGPMGMPLDDFPEAHGALGRVILVSLPTLIVEEKGNTKIVRIGERTVVRRGHDKVSPTNIAPEDFVVVIGSPNDMSEIDAKFIRILPPPLKDTTLTATTLQKGVASSTK
jgi:hypothetical protein